MRPLAIESLLGPFRTLLTTVMPLICVVVSVLVLQTVIVSSCRSTTPPDVGSSLMSQYFVRLNAGLVATWQADAVSPKDALEVVFPVLASLPTTFCGTPEEDDEDVDWRVFEMLPVAG